MAIRHLPALLIGETCNYMTSLVNNPMLKHLEGLCMLAGASNGKM